MLISDYFVFALNILNVFNANFICLTHLIASYSIFLYIFLFFKCHPKPLQMMQYHYLYWPKQSNIAVWSWDAGSILHLNSLEADRTSDTPEALLLTPVCVYDLVMADVLTAC